MTSVVLVDVNVVFAAMLEGHPARAAASEFIRGRSGGDVAFALPVQLGVLRLLSTTAAMGGSALSPPQALALWNSFVAAAHMREVTAPASLATHLQGIVKTRKASPNLWTDAWLAALALSLDIEIASFDRGFRSFDKVRFVLLKA